MGPVGRGSSTPVPARTLQGEYLFGRLGWRRRARRRHVGRRRHLKERFPQFKLQAVVAVAAARWRPGGGEVAWWCGGCGGGGGYRVVPVAVAVAVAVLVEAETPTADAVSRPSGGSATSSRHATATAVAC